MTGASRCRSCRRQNSNLIIFGGHHMAKLNQIIAVEKGIKSRTYGEISELHKAAQKAELFNGFSKSYQPLDDDGEKLPGESKRVQFIASHVMKNVERLTTEIMAVTARKDWTNCVAKGTVKIDDAVIIQDAPVSHFFSLRSNSPTSGHSSGACRFSIARTIGPWIRTPASTRARSHRRIAPRRCRSRSFSMQPRQSIQRRRS